jgi:hypothetical protein
MRPLHLPPSIEPDLLYREWERGVCKETHQTFDVVRIYVRKDDKVECLITRGKGLHALNDPIVSIERTSIDENARDIIILPIFDPKAISVPRGEHFDPEEWTGHGGLSI